MVCQRFFPSRLASRWFEVQGDTTLQGAEATNEAASKAMLAKDDPIAVFLQSQQQPFHKSSEIREAMEKSESNAWLQRVGWP